MLTVCGFGTILGVIRNRAGGSVERMVGAAGLGQGAADIIGVNSWPAGVDRAAGGVAAVTVMMAGLFLPLPLLIEAC